MCSQSSIREQLRNWLEMVKVWYRNRHSVQYAQQQHEKVPELAEYLAQLSRKLKEAESVRCAIASLPETGQFLGRLSALPFLLACPDIYRHYLQCLLAFYTERPCGEIEEKASKWALSQISYSVTKIKVDNLAIHRQNCPTSVSVPEQLKNYMISSLTEPRKSGCCSLLSPASSPPSDAALCVGRLCLNFLHIPECAEILNCLMKSLHYKCDSENRDALLDAAAKVALPYDTQVALYKMHFPALEADVLSLICSSMKEGYITKKTFHKKLADTHLVRACAENFELWAAVESILKTQHSRCGYHWMLAFVLYWLKGATIKFAQSLNSSLIFARRLFLPLTEMSLSSLEGYCTKLEKIINVDTANNFCLEDPAFCTVLYHVMFFMILISPKESRESCAKLVIKFRFPNGDNHNRDQFLQVASALACILSKSQIHVEDLKCCLAPVLYPCGVNSSQALNASDAIIQQLLLVFLCQAPLQQHAMDFLLEKATLSDDATDWLDALLDTSLIAINLDLPWLLHHLQVNQITSLMHSLWTDIQRTLPSVTCIVGNSEVPQPQYVVENDRVKGLRRKYLFVVDFLNKTS